MLKAIKLIRIYPNEVLISVKLKKETGLIKDSLILVHQIRTISKKRLASRIGNIENSEIKQEIDETLRIHLNL